MAFLIFISFLVAQRLSELYVSSKNEKWLLANGAVQYGQKHYPVMVGMHTCFLVSVIVEYYLRGGTGMNIPVLVIFLALLAFKYWVIASLGTFWNTKIYRIPGMQPVTRGIYKVVKHPNYMIVVGEIALIPLVFHLYTTAIVFSILNAAMLYVRISEENRVWKMMNDK
ncbi:isoprenylcysteine carboxyl methyltransferase family protein [Hufsiella ginkgonis]|uniref:Isoprenylcysteine carboxyl methyltransferase n=1 Tax=Hufsiella ginkgonis TaxID=2695274 RepID=A0A7K1XXH5_9SPHI|nr:isoprenylcysteine carboxylmethyltransferase family protein [Hufsiella ginkgonis]MXV15715.1 hypothetical protein [Hufsiella ginkgonis]